MGMVHLDLDFNEFPVGVESVVCARSIGAMKGLLEEVELKSVIHTRGGWIGYGNDVQQISTWVYYFTKIDALEDVNGEDVDMKTRLKRVRFT